MKKNSNSQTKTGQKTKAVKARGPVQQEPKEVMAKLVAKLSERLEQKPTQEKASGGEGTQQPRSVTSVMDLGFRSDPNLHRANRGLLRVRIEAWQTSGWR